MVRKFPGPASQRGITAIGFLLIAAVAGVVLVGVLKLLPIFIDHYQIKGVIDQIGNSSPKTPAEIRDRVAKLLDINSIRTVKPESVDIERVGSNFKVTLDYEVRTTYMGPVDFVVHFKDEQEFPAR